MHDSASRRVVPRALVRGPLPLLGPAFVTAIAYVDPGNFATNITAGATYGYLLVWVVIVSNLMAMLIQYLSAKAGIATGMSLPALCRAHFPRPVTKGLWVQAEGVAIATDLAEVVGGAIALKLRAATSWAASPTDTRPRWLPRWSPGSSSCSTGRGLGYRQGRGRGIPGPFR